MIEEQPVFTLQVEREFIEQLMGSCNVPARKMFYSTIVKLTENIEDENASRIILEVNPVQFFIFNFIATSSKRRLKLVKRLLLKNGCRFRYLSPQN